jgi:hypothetical protein
LTLVDALEASTVVAVELENPMKGEEIKSKAKAVATIAALRFDVFISLSFSFQFSEFDHVREFAY